MKLDWTVFPDGERHVRAGKTGPSATISSRLRNAEDLWEISLTADALRGRGAKRIALIVPYLGYARQDRRVRRGDSAGGPLLLRQLAAAGVTRVATVDIHSDRLRKGASLEVIDVHSWPSFAAALRKKLGRAPATIVAPDHGAMKRARSIAHALPTTESVWFEKHHENGLLVRSGLMHGRLKGDLAIIVDDMISTGVTIEATVKAVRKAGIRRVWVAVTHAVFTPGAAKRLERLGIERLLISDTLPKPKIRVPTETISVLALLKRAAY